MKTLDEHNREARERHWSQRASQGVGVACPKCGSELINTSPGELLMSNPPKMRVHCGGCDYLGNMVV